MLCMPAKSVRYVTILFFLLVTTAISFAQDSLNVSRVASRISIWDNARRITVEGDFAYVAKGEYGLSIINIQNPAAPFECGSYVDDSCYVYYVVACDTLALVANDDHGLLILDVSDVNNIETVSWFPIEGHCQDVAIQGDSIVYLPTGERIYVVDISDPADPQQLQVVEDCEAIKIIADSASVHTLGSRNYNLYTIDEEQGLVWTGGCQSNGNRNVFVVNGRYAYTHGTYSGLDVIDIGDPENPVIVSTSDARINTMVIRDSLVYAGIGGGITVYDLADSVTFEAMNNFDIYGGVDEMTLVGDYIYSTNTNYAMNIVDVSDPMNMARVGYYLELDLQHTAKSDSLVFVSDHLMGVFVFSVADPLNPTCLSRIPTNNYCDQFIIQDNFLYLTNYEEPVLIVDFSDPAHPEVVGQFEYDNSINMVDVAGDYAYLGYDDEIVIVDISNPASPTQVDIIQQDATITGYKVCNNTLFLSTYDHLIIYDVQTPTSPVFIDSTSEINPLVNMDFDGGHLFGVSWHGVEVFDISDLTDIQQMCFIEGSYWGEVDFSDGFIFVSARNDGIRVYRMDDFSAPELTGFYDHALTYYDYYSAVLFGDYLVSNNAYSVDVFDIANALPVEELEVSLMPNEFALSAAYPNPFNPTTQVQVNLPETAKLTVEVYNLNGQLVGTFASGTFAAGTHSFTIDGSGWASGMYFVRATVPGYTTQTSRLVLLK